MYPNRPSTSSSMAIGPCTSQARSIRSDRARTRLGRYVAAEHTHGSVSTKRMITYTARFLHSDRAQAKARSLRSDRAGKRLGRYVATEHAHSLEFCVSGIQ
ncbi:hypothetical protein F2Q69_00042172 [Brassica cretica]|uniref:Uncharacterized protein n=1 Tax=Brassica cretica TaxID=69181 RepID=A0A8S9NDE7_BRACR|nr:hypothetical protein F2Q69_00042172 [Brassica cretica]